MRTMRIQELMTGPPVTCGPDDTLRGAAKSCSRGRHLWWTVLATAGLAAMNCATPQPQTGVSEEAEHPRASVFSESGVHYLTNAYLFACAPEYIPYPDGQGPPVPVRTDADRREREAELTACLREVAAKCMTLENLRRVTSVGKRHSMSKAEMKCIVQHGGAFLDGYVKRLLERERQREGVSGDFAGNEPSSASSVRP
jgi:hypothetical protein